MSYEYGAPLCPACGANAIHSSVVPMELRTSKPLGVLSSFTQLEGGPQVKLPGVPGKSFIECANCQARWGPVRAFEKAWRAAGSPVFPLGLK